MHVVVRDLIHGPALALHDDVFLAAAELQIDAAIGVVSDRGSANVIDRPAFAAVVIREQGFEARRIDARQGIVPALAVVFQRHASACIDVMHDRNAAAATGRGDFPSFTLFAPCGVEDAVSNKGIP
jgi:hypothetical protein